MKKVRFTAHGDPESVLEIVDAPMPSPGKGEALVRVVAAAINPADVMRIRGTYGDGPLPPVPIDAGIEGAGVVAEVGSEVSQVKPGDLVMLPRGATWCEHMLGPAKELFALPRGTDPLQAAMLRVNPATAWLMLEQFVDLAPGEWVIQNAANSGVGHDVIALARHRGLKTVNLVRRPELVAELTAAGADAVLVPGADLPAQVREATGGANIRLALDAVAGSATGDLASCLTSEGTVVTYGLLSGAPCTVPTALVVFRGITLTGFMLPRAMKGMGRDRIANLYAKLAGLIADGTLNVTVEATYPLERVKEAVLHAERGGRGGKVLLTP